MKPSVLRSLAIAGLASVALAVAVPPAAADDVRDQIELGLDLYETGEYGAAITELEFAINDIRRMMAGRIGGTFPEAPAGWSALEVSSGSSEGAALLGALGGGSALERAYVQDNGEGRMEASLMIDNPMIQGFGAMLANPALIAAQPNMERIRVGRETGILKWEAERSQAEATLLLDGRIMVQITGTRLASAEPVQALLNAWDLAALRAQAAR